LRQRHEICDFIGLAGLGRGVKIPPSGVREGGKFKGVWVFLFGGEPPYRREFYRKIPINRGIII
jgi:hypothetical protein